MENRQGEGKNSVGNVEAKELISMTHGHELWGGNVGGRGVGGMEWSGGGKWDNCNSIINKYIKKKRLDISKSLVELLAPVGRKNYTKHFKKRFYLFIF